MRRALFIDKDGTLVVDVPYNVDPARVVLAPGAGAALARLAPDGYDFVVVSNQPGVARGLFPLDALAAVEARIQGLLAPFGVRIAAFRWCPHHPEGSVSPYALACTCRKPQPGLLQGAATALGIDLAHSWMVGDILDDVEAGHRAGCRTVFMDAGNETVWRRGPHRTPDFVVPGWAAVAAAIGAGQASLPREALP